MNMYRVKIGGITNGKGWYLPEWQNFLTHVESYHKDIIGRHLAEYNGYLVATSNGMISKEEVGFDSEQDYIHFKMRFG